MEDRLREVKPGDPISAEQWNLMVQLLKRSMTVEGNECFIDSTGTHFRRRLLRRVDPIILFDGVCMVEEDGGTGTEGVENFTQSLTLPYVGQGLALHAASPFTSIRQIMLLISSSLNFQLDTTVSGAAVKSSDIYLRLITADFDPATADWAEIQSIVNVTNRGQWMGVTTTNDNAFKDDQAVIQHAPLVPGWMGIYAWEEPALTGGPWYGVYVDYNPAAPWGPNFTSYECMNTVDVSESFIIQGA